MDPDDFNHEVKGPLIEDETTEKLLVAGIEWVTGPTFEVGVWPPDFPVDGEVA